MTKTTWQRTRPRSAELEAPPELTGPTLPPASRGKAHPRDFKSLTTSKLATICSRNINESYLTWLRPTHPEP
jgi:hypothetical protein